MVFCTLRGRVVALCLCVCLLVYYVTVSLFVSLCVSGCLCSRWYLILYRRAAYALSSSLLFFLSLSLSPSVSLGRVCFFVFVAIVLFLRRQGKRSEHTKPWGGGENEKKVRPMQQQIPHLMMTTNVVKCDSQLTKLIRFWRMVTAFTPDAAHWMLLFFLCGWRMRRVRHSAAS